MTQTTDRPPQNPTEQSPKPVGFTEIGVSGFKSFAEETRIQLGSLTILAGANSSGKSSIMQPLLLMKQTLEAPYDPGTFLLDGPNVNVTSGEQVISRSNRSSPTSKRFTTFIDIGSMYLHTIFHWSAQSGINLDSQKFVCRETAEEINLQPGMSSAEILDSGSKYFGADPQKYFGVNPQSQNLHVLQDRCFLKVKGFINYDLGNPTFIDVLRSIIHVQGVREKPERFYRTAAVSGSTFPGQFEVYVASIIDRFQKENPEQLIKIQEALQKLGLTDIVQTQRLNDTQIELRVGRVLGQADPTDTVNIADVGFGVSQVLPVIVALLVAQPGQLVYIEQPEIHLHPRAQVALSEIFADAANRGVRVVVETHSELFLMGIQALVAEDKLDPNAVKLHWFSRQSDGSSKVISADLDETGAFGDWPEDFGSIALDMANRYLSAAEAKLWNSHNGNSSHG
jgi:predicted ATPase